MKKSILLSLLLAACAVATDAGNGLTRLNTEPKDCEYLYTIDSSAITYNVSDAYDYLEDEPDEFIALITKQLNLDQNEMELLCSREYQTSFAAVLLTSFLQFIPDKDYT